jgi:hypothetical protein
MSTLFSKKQPCNTCPYRTDAPLRHWSVEEFKDLVQHEADEMGVTYMCHKKDGCVCVGWLMDQDRRGLPSIALRLSLLKHNITRTYMDALRSPFPLYESVQEMCIANYPDTFKNYTVMRYNRFQLYFDLDQDFERFPLPICMDPDEERKEMQRRAQRIKTIVDRLVSIMEIRRRKNTNEL